MEPQGFPLWLVELYRPRDVKLVIGWSGGYPMIVSVTDGVINGLQPIDASSAFQVFTDQASAFAFLITQQEYWRARP